MDGLAVGLIHHNLEGIPRELEVTDLHVAEKRYLALQRVLDQIQFPDSILVTLA